MEGYFEKNLKIEIRKYYYFLAWNLDVVIISTGILKEKDCPNSEAETWIFMGSHPLKKNERKKTRKILTRTY